MASGSNASGGQGTSDAPPRPSLDGRTSLGKYEIVRQLGAGGMGTVYLAVDTQLKRTVALKVLPQERTENETLVRRFEAEAQSAAQLKHENIITIYDAGRIEGHLFIALEYVDGTDIYELVAKRGPLPLKRAINFVKQVTHALEHLHQRGFVHRDIKPSNILVTKQGTVKLTDMGLARAVDESLQSNITREGTTVGTVDYMAPEQARNSQSADIRSDIYSLGCTWYQMLTGEPPYPTGSVTNKLYSHISKPRPDPRALNRSVPEEIVAIMHRMMARKPSDRYQTPAELLEDLENVGAGNKRIEELLRSETDDDPPAAAATPAYGTPQTLPPRHLPSRSDESSRPAGRVEKEPTPRPVRLPARRGRTEGDRTPPPQRLPGRYAEDELEPNSPPPQRLPGRYAEDELEPNSPPPQRSPGRYAEDELEPDSPPSQRAPGRQAKGELEPNPPPQRVPGRYAKDELEPNSPPARSPGRHAPGIPKVPAARSGGRLRRNRSVSEEPVMTPREARTPRNNDEGAPSIDWKPFAVKAATVVGGVVALGLCVWWGLSWRRSAASHVPKSAAASPFAPVSANLPGEEDKTEVSNKSNSDATNADGNRTTVPKDSRVLVKFKKAGNDANLSDVSAVLGRPEERKNFPSWIPELWNPNAPPAPKGAAELKTVTVGRDGNDRADWPSLAAAIDGLPEQGGIVELHGRGPFLLPALKITNRRRLIITGVKARNASSNGTIAAGGAKAEAENENEPLIVIVPGTSPAADSGLLAIATSLTLYNVHLAAFAEQFPSDNPLRLIDVRSGDLIVQKSSLTLIGSRNGSTIAFSVSVPVAKAGSDHPTRILLDRTFVRGKDLTAIDADLPAVDLLAINSLFVTGKAPVLNLLAGPGLVAQTAAGTAVPRTLRFFSCTTCTDEAAVSLRADAGGDNPPATRFRVMNSVFGAVFQPQGAAMVVLNNWPRRPITATNHVAFENLAWMTESFIARGWQNLVRNDVGAPFGTKDAGGWATYWGEPGSTVDYEPASFPAVPQIATADPARFKLEGTAGLPNAVGDTGPPGCDVGLLAVASPDTIARADALTKRPKVPPSFAVPSTGDSNVREIDLDNLKRVENLARIINHADWKTGTRFLVRGTNKKSCGPIHVTNKSLCIEFVDETPPLLTFEDTRGESRDHPAVITVTGGTIEIVHANFRVGSSAKHLPHWFLDVKDGSFSIRDSLIEGPSFERTGYEGLIHFSAVRSAAAVPAKTEKAFCGHISNSFVCTSKTLLSGDFASRNLFVENSILAANGRVFDLRIPATSSVPPAVDLQACTLAAGAEYFHFDAGAAGNAASRVRVFAENTVFAPPLQTNGEAGAKPILIGGLSPTSIADALDWWEYACAYSNLIGLPNSGGEGVGTRDPLTGWSRVAGRAHIVRSIGNPNAVVLPHDLPPAKDLVPGDFRLKTEAEAATWSDTGKPIGAILAAQPGTASALTPPAKAKESGSHKTSPTKKPAAKATGI
jgi:serine/threonine protein kinase